ncbi:MAG: hypothetical protein ACEQSC_01210 [Candidatus Nanopelagicaceae bacterium]
MPIFCKQFPQGEKPIIRVTLAQLVKVLPEKLPYELNVWVSGRLSRDGVTSENITFIAEIDIEPSNEQKEYFNSLVKPLGLAATLSENWRKKDLALIRLYNHGRKILDDDLRFIEPPAPISLPPELTAQYIRYRLPKEISILETIWFTGSIVKNGFSSNDLDILVGDLDDKGQTLNYEANQAPRLAVKKYFSELLSCKVDCGVSVMPEREPVYLIKAYEGGKLCLV